MSATYSNTNKTIFAESYKKYFDKLPGAKVVRSRGKTRISDYLALDLEAHTSSFMPGAFTVNDPDSALTGIRQNENKFMILDEGLISTYPTEKTLRYFKRLFAKYVCPDLVDATFPGTTAKISDFCDLSDPNERVSPLMIVCVPAKDDADCKRLVKLVTDEIAKTGYYMTSYDVNDVEKFKLVYLQFEAKYTNMLSDLEPILYHVSPLKYFDKILKNGLVPTAKALNFKYPPRVYMFNKCPKEQVFEYGLYKTAEAGDNGFCVFKIRRDALLADPIFKDGKQRFYLDPAFSVSDTTDQTAIFTYGNVPFRVLEREYVIASVEDGRIISIDVDRF